MVEQLVEQRRIGWLDEVTFDGFGAAEKLVNFESWNYALDPESQLPYLRKGIETFLAESLMLPTERRVIVDPIVGITEMDGRVNREVFERSIAHFQGNELVVRRFEAEKDGFSNAERLIFVCAHRYDALPPFVIASPPGEVYENSDAGVAKSLTFVGIPLGQDEQGRPIYSLYSIPSDEIEIEAHVDLIESVGRFQDSLEILNYALDVRDPNSVVAMPAILENMEESLEELAIVLGYENWSDIDSQTEIAASFIENGDETEARRAYLVGWFEGKILEAIVWNGSRGDMAVIDEVMRQVFAAERGGFFLENGFKKHRVIGEFLQRQLDGEGYKQANSVVDVSGGFLIYAEDVAIQREMFMRWMMTSTLAMDSYAATGCGGGSVMNTRMADVFSVTNTVGWGLEQDSHAMIEMSGLGDYDFTVSSSSTGKYKDDFIYKPGKCKKCGKHKLYVAHPKNSGTKCAGWCSECEK